MWTNGWTERRAERHDEANNHFSQFLRTRPRTKHQVEMAFAMNACKPNPESALLLSTQG